MGLLEGYAPVVQVDMNFEDYSGRWLKVVIVQSGLSREEFYASTKSTAKKINVPYAFSKKR